MTARGRPLHMHSDSVERLGESGPLAVRDGVEGLIACIVLESCNRNGSSGLGQAVSLA